MLVYVRQFCRRLTEICRLFCRRRTEISCWLNTWRSLKHGWSRVHAQILYICSVRWYEMRRAWSHIQTVNTDFETTTSSFSKNVTNTCFQHVFNINTSRTTWKHCHVYRVSKGYPRGYLLIIHWSKNAMWRNPPRESKRAARSSTLGCLPYFKIGNEITMVKYDCRVFYWHKQLRL